MAGVSLTGKDTVSIGSTGAQLRIFTDFADGDTVDIEFPNNLVESKTGKNGNTIYAFNSTGQVATMKIRVLRGSSDDKYLNGEMNLFIADPSAYPLLEGEFIKRVGDGQGNVTNDIYKVSGGVVQKIPVVKENVEGDTEQSVTLYQIAFANTERSIA